MNQVIHNAAWFDRTARAAIATLPESFQANLAAVVIRVEELPERAVLDDLGIQSPFDLLGLYSGVSLAEKSAWDVPHGPDMIFLYRRPILAFATASGEMLDHVIRHVIIHEAGHHFGLSDDEMAAIENQ
ncbi:MAG: metallopeptidase family protein [Sphingomonadales bacterium]